MWNLSIYTIFFFIYKGNPDGDVYPKVRSISAHRIKTGTLMDDIFVKTSKPHQVNELKIKTKNKLLINSSIEFGIFNYFLVLISGVILGAVLLETCAISFVMPVSQCDLKLTTKEKGVLGAVGSIGMIFSSHLWGYLADTKGRRIVIMPTLMIAFVLAVSSSVTDNFYIFALLRFLNGFL